MVKEGDGRASNATIMKRTKISAILEVEDPSHAYCFNAISS